MDCFGDPKVTGKVGTDIEDNKCSWLVVQALAKANTEQRALLEVSSVACIIHYHRYGLWLTCITIIMNVYHIASKFF